MSTPRTIEEAELALTRAMQRRESSRRALIEMYGSDNILVVPREAFRVHAETDYEVNRLRDVLGDLKAKLRVATAASARDQKKREWLLRRADRMAAAAWISARKEGLTDGNAKPSALRKYMISFIREAAHEEAKNQGWYKEEEEKLATLAIREMDKVHGSPPMQRRKIIAGRKPKVPRRVGKRVL